MSDEKQIEKVEKVDNSVDQDLAKADLPTTEDQKKLEDIVKQAIPQYSEYVGATFNYIGEAMKKMATTNDRDAASKEIAEDLKSKWENFVKEREANKNNETVDEKTGTTSTTTQ